jgi:thioesterase domain-containing protein
MLSFEMARRLAESGKPAPLVILMDTPAPGFPKIVPEIVRHRKAYWNEMLRALRGERHAAREITGQAAKLVALLKRRAARSIDRVLIGAGVPKPVPGSEDPTAGNCRAARNYMPVPFSGKVVQLMTTEGLVDREIWEDSRLAWREFAQGGFESHIVPGTHASMLVPPNVWELGRRLRSVLDEADGSPGGRCW